MIAGVIAIAGKNSKVIKPVIVLVAVLMVDNMAVFESKMLRYNGSGNPARLPVGNVGRSSLHPCEPTVSAAEVVIVPSHAAPGSMGDSPAGSTGHWDLMLRGVYASPAQDLVDPLAADAVLDGEILSPGHLHIIGMHYVNLLSVGQSDTLSHSCNLHDLMPEFTRFMDSCQDE